MNARGISCTGGGGGVLPCLDLARGTPSMLGVPVWTWLAYPHLDLARVPPIWTWPGTSPHLDLARVPPHLDLTGVPQPPVDRQTDRQTDRHVSKHNLSVVLRMRSVIKFKFYAVHNILFVQNSSHIHYNFNIVFLPLFSC